jgi:glycerol-3-phosphate dehydrogenase (NAD(P)+)
VALAGKLGVEMPIASGVDAILNQGAPIEAAIEALLARPFRAEFP